MPYTFSQSSGLLSKEGTLIGKGWAGQGEGKNNGSLETVHNIGPLPRGKYHIGRAYTHPHLGPVVMNLTPHPGNFMYGRSGFRIHGASSAHPETSSQGCIIQEKLVRIRIDIGADKDLEVIA